ncbi:5-oxoprolinase subunit PxpA [Agarivorans sp. Alg241-V36]|uniref:5-oxoprolinase subunit PxpA n=1 Tax=Agarivorans sp. Alg241-V36 TaxID=2305992 RepID=UPI0013D416DB|nr:5-oxoprolinase subunit PxpA [Agarivorans sp. Alg241-V36]
MLLNCDMGESFGVWEMGVDEQLMPHVDLANIACGGHASDPNVMSKTLALAKQYDVTIGAHPSYADVAGFGRRSIPYQADELTHLVLTQIGALDALCQFHQLKLSYVKPHGALYNDMHKNPEIFESVCRALTGLNQVPQLMVHATQCQGFISELAERYQLSLIKEAFADRRYLSDGSLQARSQAGALLTSKEQLLEQVSLLLSQRSLRCADGSLLKVEADTLCVHGDNQAAVKLVQAIKKQIQMSNID